MKLPLLSLLLVGLCTPALAQISMTLPSEMPDVSMPSDDMNMTVSAPDDGTDTTEPSGPPVASKDALKLFVDTCTIIAGAEADAATKVKGLGWQADDATDTGPFVSIFSGYQDLGGYGSVDLWSSLETYPSSRLGYCRVDFPDSDNRVDFNDVTGLGGLAGSVKDAGGGNAFGSWETPDHKFMLTASRQDGQAQMEFNMLLPAAPAN
ncbi:MAG: hypothetical protein ABI697_12035 [Devosia sp.]